MLLPPSEKQKNARAHFAQHHFANRTVFKRIMSTNSRDFELHKPWLNLVAKRLLLMSSIVRSPCALGTDMFWPTEPIFLAGASKKSNVTSSHESEALPCEVLLQLKTWIFQQENAPVHTARMNKELLNDLPDG